MINLHRVKSALDRKGPSGFHRFVTRMWVSKNQKSDLGFSSLPPTGSGADSHTVTQIESPVFPTKEAAQSTSAQARSHQLSEQRGDVHSIPGWVLTLS